MNNEACGVRGTQTQKPRAGPPVTWASTQVGGREAVSASTGTDWAWGGARRLGHEGHPNQGQAEPRQGPLRALGLQGRQGTKRSETGAAACTSQRRAAFSGVP